MVIKDKMAAAKNRPSGFDYMRIVLAVAVVSVHFVTVDYGDKVADALWHTWRRPLPAIVLPMFFALSGYLVAGSLLRSKSLISFGGLRILRIAPALSVEILLCAFILGPALTTLPLSQYFHDRLFYRYFFNLIGHVQFLLPGVFASNPHPNVVNDQLWTIPWELRCYVLIAGMSLLGLVRNRYVLLGFSIVMYIAVLFYFGMQPPGGWVSVDGPILVESFLAGIVIFAFSDTIPYNKWMFLLSLALTLGCLSFPPIGDYFVAFPAAYITVYLGLLNPPRNAIVLSGDYSYGVYLYGFPIQQAVANINTAHHEWYIDALIVLPITFAVAASSWWFVEKPTLALRKYLPPIETWTLGIVNPALARLRKMFVR